MNGRHAAVASALNTYGYHAIHLGEDADMVVMNLRVRQVRTRTSLRAASVL